MGPSLLNDACPLVLHFVDLGGRGRWGNNVFDIVILPTYAGAVIANTGNTTPIRTITSLVVAVAVAITINSSNSDELSVCTALRLAF